MSVTRIVVYIEWSPYHFQRFITSEDFLVTWTDLSLENLFSKTSTLATWCEELTHLKRPWCWERLRAGGERDDRGWDGWMASPTRWTQVWVDSGSWWCTGKPGMLQFMGLQRVGHEWATELNWTHQQQLYISIDIKIQSPQPQMWIRETGKEMLSLMVLCLYS